MPMTMAARALYVEDLRIYLKALNVLKEIREKVL